MSLKNTGFVPAKIHKSLYGAKSLVRGFLYYRRQRQTVCQPGKNSMRTYCIRFICVQRMQFLKDWSETIYNGEIV